jgi:hypothetical protein
LTGTIPSSWALPAGMSSLTRFVASSNVGLCGAFPGNWTTAKVPSTSTGLGSLCPQTRGLLSLVSAVTTATWPSGMSGWTNSTEACGIPWTGVTCSGPTAIALDLSYYGFQGSLPPNLSLVSGLRSLILGSNRWVCL